MKKIIKMILSWFMCLWILGATIYLVLNVLEGNIIRCDEQGHYCRIH